MGQKDRDLELETKGVISFIESALVEKLWKIIAQNISLFFVIKT